MLFSSLSVALATSASPEKPFAFTHNQHEFAEFMSFLIAIRERARGVLIGARTRVLRSLWGYDLAPSAMISFGAILDRTHPAGVHVDRESIITRGAVVLSHDYAAGSLSDTFIGYRCFIGVNAIIMPGVKIGDHCVVGAGAVVTRDLPANSLAVGNPARVVRRIMTAGYGRIEERARLDLTSTE